MNSLSTRNLVHVDISKDVSPQLHSSNFLLRQGESIVALTLKARAYCIGEHMPNFFTISGFSSIIDFLATMRVI